MRDISYLIDFFGKMDGQYFNKIYEHVIYLIYYNFKKGIYLTIVEPLGLIGID